MRNIWSSILMGALLGACGYADHLTGDRSSHNEPGPKGDKGDQGIQGVAGDTGRTGASGATGTSGKDGRDGAVGPTGSQGATGATGSSGVAGRDGLNGQNGQNGSDGAAGTMGAPGKNGIDGKNAPQSPYSPVGLIRPCGDASSPWKEVLICLANGTLLSSFSDNASGSNTRLVIIPPGSYGDTDNSGCQFIVSSSSGDKQTTVSWAAGSNQYATWAAGSTTCGGTP